MKRFALALSLLVSFATHAQAGTVTKAKLYEVSKSGLTPSDRVEDSVFLYQPEELACDPDGDEETPCLATVDHWETVCFQGDIESVCSAFKSLFRASSKQLLEDGAEEDVQLVSCSSESGIPTLSYDLISYHGGPNVKLKDKMIPMCPIFIK